MTPPDKSVALVTLGCTRNEVDSEELAGRLLAGGWRLVDDAAEADQLLAHGDADRAHQANTSRSSLSSTSSSSVRPVAAKNASSSVVAP